MKTQALDVTRCRAGGRAALRAAVLAAVAIAAFPAGEMRMAAAEECTGPFRQCAISVSAKCERTPEGKQLIVYYDYPGKVMSFERCVGKVFEAAGKPNPYTTTPARVASERSRRQAGSADLPLPDSLLLYPTIRER